VNNSPGWAEQVWDGSSCVGMERLSGQLDKNLRDSMGRETFPPPLPLGSREQRSPCPHVVPHFLVDVLLHGNVVVIEQFKKHTSSLSM
jgi:hypothetical protein